MISSMSRRLRLTRWVVAALAVTAAACNRDKRPPVRENPADTAISTAEDVAMPVVSRFQAPLAYDFTPILAVVERAVPKTFGSLDSVKQIGDDKRKHYAFVATRDTFTTFMRGQLVHLKTTISYRAKGYYKPPIGPTIGAGCGNDKEQPQIQIELVTPISLNKNWHLRSESRLEKLEPATDQPKDKCIVSILKYDVTSKVIDAARQAITKHLPDIDSKIAKIDLTQRASGWWDLLNRPIRLRDGVWLQLQPRQFRLGSVKGSAHTMTVDAGLDAFPKIVTGAEPKTSPRPLPTLARDTSGVGFQIALDGIVDFETASKAVNDALRGKSVTQAAQTVTVKSVAVGPLSGGRIVLSVMFTGDATGALRFIGTPHLDADHDHVLVPDLDYDLQTNNDLINAFSRLRSDAFREMFREKATVPIKPALQQGKTLLLAGLNRTIGDVMTISARVDSVAVIGLRVTRAGLMVRAGAYGNASISVRQKADPRKPE
jgi:hypothetical protein